MNWTKIRKRKPLKKALGISLVGILALNTPFSSLNRVYANQPEYENEESYGDDGYDDYDNYEGDSIQDDELMDSNDDQDLQQVLISEWNWNLKDKEESLFEAKDGFWYLNWSDASEGSDLNEEDLLSLLPESIKLKTSDEETTAESLDEKTEEQVADEETAADSFDEEAVSVPITWDMEDLKQKEEKEFYQLKAVLPEGYELAPDAKPLLILVEYGYDGASAFDPASSEDSSNSKSDLATTGNLKNPDKEIVLPNSSIKDGFGALKEKVEKLTVDLVKDKNTTDSNDDQTQKPILISKWSWNDEEELLSEIDGAWYLGLPGVSDRSLLTDDVLSELLPKSITVTAFETETEPTTFDEENVKVSITWKSEDLDEKSEGIYTITAVLPEEYQLATDAQSLQVFLDCAEATTFVGYYPNMDGLTSISDEEALKTMLEKHTVTGMTPEGTTVNLFDYTVDVNKLDVNGNLTGNDLLNNGNTADSSYWNKGINTDRLLLFGDMIVGAGYWNIGAGAGKIWAQRNTNMKGIAESTLGINGYPVVNIENSTKTIAWKDDETLTNLEYANNASTPSNKNDAKALSDDLYNKRTINGNPSLQYLFDPTVNVEATKENGQTESYKTSYTNVQDLFQIDEQGYFYYDARKNFAEYDADNNKFVLYDSPAIWRTDGGWTGGSGWDAFNGEYSTGNFFPFNKGEQVFDQYYIDKNGKQRLTSSQGLTNNNTSTGLTNTATNKQFNINHHMGMTMTVDFTQPQNGKLNMGTSGQQDMVFQFSGDDDVWIFVDDVLVLDLGGIHSELYGTINFATGEVVVGQSWRTGGIPTGNNNRGGDTKTNLYALFKAALEEKETETELNSRFTAGIDNTDEHKIFPTGTTHSLKLFYLERGNYDSSLALRFNLQPPLYHSVKKVDQDGKPLEGAIFNLYTAQLKKGVNSETTSAEGYEVIDGEEAEPIASLTTSKDGKVSFTRSDGTPFSFSDDYSKNHTQYYILQETTAPAGYRKLPTDIILKFVSSSTGSDPSGAAPSADASMLVVVNRYETGAYASFFSNILETGKLTYGAFDEMSGAIEASETELAPENKENGLVVAVPMLLEQSESVEGGTEGSGKWVALYGSNTDGYKAVEPAKRTAAAWRTAILKAALYQASDSNWPGWYLKYNQAEERLTGILEDLPGRSDRYALTNPKNADMKMVYGIIESSAFQTLGISFTEDSHDLYQALETWLSQQIKNKMNQVPALSRNDAVDAVVNEIVNKLEVDSDQVSGRDFSFLNTDQFQRTFRSTIYIPNERRELRVQKIGEDGKGINDVEFTLTDSDGKVVAQGTTGTVNDQDGVLIFRPDLPVEAGNFAQNGYAKMIWGDPGTPYILKETNAPDRYEPNDTEIPIVVGIYSIYADAGAKDDGVTVMAGVGNLMQTMTKYAADERVNTTLRFITAIAQTQESGSFDLQGWNDDVLSQIEETTSVLRSMNLQYGVNNVVDYGLSDEDGGKTILPFFTTDTGFLRTRVVQNTSASRNGSANWDKLGEQDLTNLFSLLNTVVVTNKSKSKPNFGELTIRKVVIGDKIQPSDYTEIFHFKVNLSDKDGNSLKDDFYYFYGDNKAGMITDGGDLYLKHDEAVTIRGLPEGTQWTVTEVLDQESDWKVFPSSGKVTGTIESGETDRIEFKNYKQNPRFGNLAVSKTVDGNAGDTSKEFNFTVMLQNSENKTENINGTFGEMEFKNGVAEFTLKNGETKTAEGLPAGIQYSVNETEADRDWYKTTVENENASGTIENNTTAEVKFTNTRNVRKLSVSKTVGGAMGDKNKDFGFTLTLKNVGGKESIPYTITTKSSSGKDEPIENKVTITSNGEATCAFTLKHNQTFSITLPEGAEFVVTEDSGSREGYDTTVTASGDTKTKPITVTKDEAKASGEIPDNDVAVSYTNTKEGKPVTGIDDQNPAWMIAAAGGAALIAVLLLMKKYRYEKE